MRAKFSSLAGVCLALAVTGCAPRDPLERVVNVPSASRFSAWRAHVASDYNSVTARAVETALQEIRLSVVADREVKRQMGESVAGGTPEIDESVRKKVEGRRLREVFQLGLELRLRRLRQELAGLEDAMKKNARLVTRPGDLESRHHLEGLQERQMIRVENYRTEIAAAERDLAPLFAKSGKPLIEPPDTLRAPTGGPLK
jgi:hypothetical protein